MQDALDPIVEDAQLEAAVQEQIANAQAVIGACMAPSLGHPEEPPIGTLRLGHCEEDIA